MKIIVKSIYKPFLFLLILAITSCEKDTPEVVEEQEVITTVTIEFTAADNPTQTFRWQMDQANTQTITLKANTPYEVSIAFLDESDPGDVEDITEEVVEEADEHQVFYEFSDVTVAYTSGDLDTLDSNNNPVFIHSIWTASSTGTGIARAYLIHEPTTKTSTTRNGFGGETDVAIDIPIAIVD